MIIEKLTGEEYEKWMQKNLLEPAGCVDMHLAHNYYKNRYPNEVRYYMQDNDPLVPEYQFRRQCGALLWRQQCQRTVRRRSMGGKHS